MRNNLLKFYGKRRWESAGLKIHCPTDSIIRDNKIQDNYCHGIWSDQGISNGVFERNELSNNHGSGINIEIGKATSGKIRQCTFDNNECGISLVTAGGVLIENNTFLYSQKADIQTILFNRTADKWDSNNVFIYSNQFRKSPIYMMLTPKDNVIPANRYLNNNNYLCKKDEKKFVLGKTSYHFDDWKKQWNAMNGDKDYDENSVCM
jgi:parallel beta-helix repeat protein